MRLLLDSHVVLWVAGLDPSLGSQGRAIIKSAGETFFSAATLWELGIKRSKGKIFYPDSLISSLNANGFVELPITAAHAERAAVLPLHHQDPFDRMLVAQVQIEALTLVTADPVLSAYPVEVIDPRK
ncbi:type II toxin-antitoxin system VapC family toxin [Candidatus Poriferisocius sp.]|uniref:type II toxin-antitoxin system VapC family toxin n=1 Tax=Candidatus Poriferisocius sp. TaxID=3101276 RepID=UPI003B01CBF3